LVFAVSQARVGLAEERGKSENFLFSTLDYRFFLKKGLKKNYFLDKIFFCGAFF